MTDTSSSSPKPSLPSPSPSSLSSKPSSKSSSLSSSLSSLCDWCVTLLHARYLGDHHLYPNDCLYYCYPTSNDIDHDHHHVETKNNKEKNYQPERHQRNNLPNIKNDYIRIVIISDTHDRHDMIGNIPNGDILLHCGDILMTARFFSHNNVLNKLKEFNKWLETLPYKKDNIYVIGGNHDLHIESLGYNDMKLILSNAMYLENEQFTIGNLTCFATPLSSGKSHNKAFQSPQFKEKTINLVPDKVDVLITHGHCPDIESIVDHKIHIWGHAHNAYGIRFPGEYLRNEPIQSLSICAPMMDRQYNLSHLPIVLDIPNNNIPKLPTIKNIDNNTTDKKIKKSIMTRMKKLFQKKKILADIQ